MGYVQKVDKDTDFSKCECINSFLVSQCCVQQHQTISIGPAHKYPCTGQDFVCRIYQNLKS